MPLRRQNRLLFSTLALAVALLCAPVEAIAQGDPAIWEESVSWTHGWDQELEFGVDPAAPEPLSVSESQSSWNAQAAIEFSGYPPGVAAESSTWNSSLDSEGVMAYTDVSITLHFEIVQIEDPGVFVYQIPFTVEVVGAVSAEADDGYGNALATFDLVSTEHLGVYFAQISAFADQGQDSDSFEIDGTVWQGAAVLGEVFRATVYSSTEANSWPEPNVSGDARAQASLTIPAIRLKDENIGGTVHEWEDCYEILFCDGFFALGDPTPTEPTSWSSIKAMYGR